MSDGWGDASGIKGKYEDDDEVDSGETSEVSETVETNSSTETTESTSMSETNCSVGSLDGDATIPLSS